MYNQMILPITASPYLSTTCINCCSLYNQECFWRWKSLLSVTDGSLNSYSWAQRNFVVGTFRSVYLLLHLCTKHCRYLICLIKTVLAGVEVKKYIRLWTGRPSEETVVVVYSGRLWFALIDSIDSVSTPIPVKPIVMSVKGTDGAIRRLTPSEVRDINWSFKFYRML